MNTYPYKIKKLTPEEKSEIARKIQKALNDINLEFNPNLHMKCYKKNCSAEFEYRISTEYEPGEESDAILLCEKHMLQFKKRFVNESDD